ncbi:uncharacterized protein LOC143446807 [Clavelina lepadiformis]|uniref:uncharacterized protein LOC143446807 n=1 Tax=Clavelina lepadiformis TaxID=159417 RepID=UPI004042B0FB
MYSMTILLLFAWPICCAQVWVPSSYLKDMYLDGSNGSCRFNKYHNPVCAGSWKDMGKTKMLRNSLSKKPQCSYNAYVSTRICYSLAISGSPKEQCVRKRYYYYLNRECYSEWLDWEPCDKSCGGGTSQRYRFNVGAKSYSKQVRSCHQQACEAWTHWQPAELKCNENCTKLWTRQCVYNGSVVKPGRCLIDSFISNGNVTHQRLPCVVSNCPGFVRKELPQDRTSLNGSDTQTNTTTSIPVGRLFLNQNEDTKPTGNGLSFELGFVLGVAVILVFVVGFIAISRTQRGKKAIAALKVSATRTKQLRRFDNATYSSAPSDPQIAAITDEPRRSMYVQPSLRRPGPSTVTEASFVVTGQDPANENPYHCPDEESNQQPCADVIADPVYADIPAYAVNESDNDDFFTDSDLDSQEELETGNTTQQTIMTQKPVASFVIEEQPDLTPKETREESSKRPNTTAFLDSPHSDVMPDNDVSQNPPLPGNTSEDNVPRNKPSVTYSKVIRSSQHYNRQNYDHNFAEDKKARPKSKKPRRKPSTSPPRPPASSLNSSRATHSRLNSQTSVISRKSSSLRVAIPEEGDYGQPLDSSKLTEDDYDTYNVPFGSHCSQ